MKRTHECVVVAAVLLSACGQQAQEPTEQEARTPRSEEAPATADQSPLNDWSYNPIGKRDPYRPFFPTEPPGAGACGDDPLQCFAIEQLRLTGVVWGEHPRALLEDPDGGSHVVELGTYVGNRWGRITHIESNSVVVTEEYLDGSDELVVHPVRLRLDELG